MTLEDGGAISGAVAPVSKRQTHTSGDSDAEVKRLKQVALNCIYDLIHVAPLHIL